MLECVSGSKRCVGGSKRKMLPLLHNAVSLMGAQIRNRLSTSYRYILRVARCLTVGAVFLGAGLFKGTCMAWGFLMLRLLKLCLKPEIEKTTSLLWFKT